MLKIRLSRGGTKKRPVYKVVVADSRRARDGRFIEKVGFFNPLLPKDKKERVGLEAERIKHWLDQGAQPTTRVARLLGEHEIIPMPVNGNNPNKGVPKKDRKKEGDDAPSSSTSSRAPKRSSSSSAAAPKEEAPAAEQLLKKKLQQQSSTSSRAPKEEAPAAEQHQQQSS